MKFLQMSVCMFATIVVTCFYTRNYFYHHLYLLMVIFGILNHGLERKNDNSKNKIAQAGLSPRVHGRRRCAGCAGAVCRQARE